MNKSPKKRQCTVASGVLPSESSHGIAGDILSVFHKMPGFLVWGLVDGITRDLKKEYSFTLLH